MADANSRRERLIYLDKQKLIKCGRCPPHRGDNYGRLTWERKKKNWRNWDPFNRNNKTAPKRLLRKTRQK